MVHVVLAIVSLVMGTAIGRLGWKGLKASKAAASVPAPAPAPASAPEAASDAPEENAEKQPQQA